MIKNYQEFIFEDVKRSESIIKNRMNDYQKLKDFLTKNNKIGYLGKFTEFLFSAVPYSEIINLYNKLIDLKNKNIRIDIDKFKTYELVLDEVSKLYLSYKFKFIYNQFPKEQKDAFKNANAEDLYIFSKLYELDYKPFINKISRYKSKELIIHAIKRFIDSKSKILTREEIKSMLDENLVLKFENKNIIILKTIDHQSIVKIGSDTSWCIVSSKSTFSFYTSNNKQQFVIIDYTKDFYDVDFKIGFTLNNKGEIVYAHDIMDSPVIEYTYELLQNNNVNIKSLNDEKKDDIKIDIKYIKNTSPVSKATLGA